MLHPRLAPAVAAGAIVAFLLCGCTTPDPAPVPSSAAPTAAPVFASDEEALAAGKNSYAEFQRISDAILADGGEDPERLLSVATRGVYEHELSGFNQIAADGNHGSGSSKFDSVSLQSANLMGGPQSLVLYLCEDIGGTDIRNSSEKSVVRADRVERWPLQITFDYLDGKLLLSDESDWTGDNFC